MICLDSSFLIDVLSGKKEALQKLKDIKGEKSFTTSVCEYELMNGAYLRNYSLQKIEKIVSFLNSVPIYDFDSNAALAASKIFTELVKMGREIDDKDCMIAGIAVSNGCNKVITKNIEHFQRIENLKAIPY